MLKAECHRQNVSAEDVAMDGLYELCSDYLRDDRDGGGYGGVGRKKHEKKKKGLSAKAKIDQVSGQAARGTGPAVGGGGGPKLIRSPLSHDVDGADRPRRGRREASEEEEGGDPQSQDRRAESPTVCVPEGGISRQGFGPFDTR
jgi:hypothetical protein